MLHLVRYGSREHVVRVECITLPTAVYSAGESDLGAFYPYCRALELLAQAPPLAPDAIDPCSGP